MITIIILCMLTYAFYIGASRGLTLQLIYSVGYTLSYIVAAFLYRGVGRAIELWVPYPSATLESRMVFFNQDTALQLDKSFYAGMGFLIVYFLGYLVVRLIGLLAHSLADIRMFGELNRVLGGLAGAFAVYIGIFLVLSILSLVPINGLQDLLGNDLLAKMIIQYTPIFSSDIHHLWIVDILGKI
ncbi:MAG: CvpA family protein [Streptococcaceae bacterium]|jgi:uncharacterized membrane protein required for colicin V production|nr:CvpA family protein [Streptococcaceae bacterium]